jgi:phosphopantothenoylcysteine decarboxylase/phosphopantothenate--cysteine ligase
MWNQPATQRNLARLRQDGVRVLEPDSGEMACRTIGPGRLSEPQLIVAEALDLLASSAIGPAADLAAERILITAGATREDIDPVRFISNKSSGKMGFAIAEAAMARGAEVTIVAGVTSAEPPTRARMLRALSAEAMLKAVEDELADATAFIGAAAVSDFRPAKRAPEKIKKSDTGRNLTLELEPTPDILRNVGSRRHAGLVVVGFAAETNDVVQNALAKLEGKNLDIIVANDVNLAGAGFDTETNVVTILSKALEQPLALPLMSKLDVAHRILDEIVNIRRIEIHPSEPAGAASR